LRLRLVRPGVVRSLRHAVTRSYLTLVNTLAVCETPPTRPGTRSRSSDFLRVTGRLPVTPTRSHSGSGWQAFTASGTGTMPVTGSHCQWHGPGGRLPPGQWPVTGTASGPGAVMLRLVSASASGPGARSPPASLSPATRTRTRINLPGHSSSVWSAAESEFVWSESEFDKNACCVCATTLKQSRNSPSPGPTRRSPPNPGRLGVPSDSEPESESYQY
jgi:hypothetical protein